MDNSDGLSSRTISSTSLNSIDNGPDSLDEDIENGDAIDNINDNDSLDGEIMDNLDNTEWVDNEDGIMENCPALDDTKNDHLEQD